MSLLVVHVLSIIENHSNIDMTIISTQLSSITRIFYSLNSQDLVDIFEDNLDSWMQNFLIIMDIDTVMLCDAKANILEICGLFVQNYDDEFEPYVNSFVNKAFGFLSSTPKDQDYDHVFYCGINFIAKTVKMPKYSAIFGQEKVLAATCSCIIVPQLFYTVDDDNILDYSGNETSEYIKQDLERGHFGSRRRAVVELLDSLASQYEELTVTTVSNFATKLLLTSSQSDINWHHKDVALFLATSMASRYWNSDRGVTRVNRFIDVDIFLNTTIVPEIMGIDVDTFPVCVFGNIKRLSYF